MTNLKTHGPSAAKPQLGIVPMHALTGAARVLADSATVYAPGNFMESRADEGAPLYDSALLRHRLKCQPLSGVVTAADYAALDGDSGLPHIDHMIAGLLILRTLMIRDGVLPEDPGIGKREARAAGAPEMARAASFHMGDAPPTPDAQPSDAPSGHGFAPPGFLPCTRPMHTTGPCAHRPAPEALRFTGASRALFREQPAPPTDAELADDARRAAAEAEIARRAADTAAQEAARFEYEHRCVVCYYARARGYGRGMVENGVDSGSVPCTTCKGTGYAHGKDPHK